MIPAEELRVLRIGVTDRILGDNIAGTREILADMAGHLRQLDYVVYSPRRNGYDSTSFGANFTVYPTRSLSKLHFFLDAFRLASRLHRECRYHLVETLDPMGSGLVGYWLKKRFGLPLLVICHSDYYSSPAWRRLSPRYALLDHWLSIRMLRRADHVRAYSDRVRKDIMRFGVSSDRITVLTLPMRTHLFSAGADTLERYGQGRALFVGRLDPAKDVATLLRAWRLLADRGLQAHLTLVGSGPEVARLKALARELALGTTVDFAGFRKQEELPYYYQTSSVFVLPSASEAFGQVIVEAGLCGLATVATHVGGIPESVVHEQTGLLVPPGDPERLCAALARCFVDPELIRRMGREAQRQFRERWSYEAIMTGYVEMLARVAALSSDRSDGA